MSSTRRAFASRLVVMENSAFIMYRLLVDQYELAHRGFLDFS